jgi:hypothetical protein
VEKQSKEERNKKKTKKEGQRVKKKEKEERGVDSSITPPSENTHGGEGKSHKELAKGKRKTLPEVLSLQTREKRVNFICQFSDSAYLHGYIYNSNLKKFELIVLYKYVCL